MGIARALPLVVLPLILSGCATHRTVRPVVAPEPGMMEISRGDFTMGRNAGPINEQPSHEVKLRRYFLDRTEVTAANFATFLNAEGNRDERFFTPDERATVVAVIAEDGSVRYEPRPGFASHPANNVSWYGADAYCRWRGRRLPTEAEWEKGARWTDERRYPWGQPVPEPHRARFAQDWDELHLNVLMPVEALPEGVSVYGLLHMSGNVMEWVHDWYRQNLCDFCSPEVEAHLRLRRLLTGETEVTEEGLTDASRAAGTNPERPPPEALSGAAETPRQRQAPPREDPTGPSTGAFRVLRGGSWQEVDPEDLLTTRRFWLDPAQRFPNTGFRCAKDPAEREAPQQQPPRSSP